MASRHDRMTLHNWDGVTVLDLGEMDIWDGADLSLLRETLVRVIEVDERQRVGVNMEYVKYIPSGFFGMLYDWHEKGIEIHLYSPQPNVANMLWFRQFFGHVNDGCHVLLSEPKYELPADTQAEYAEESWWREDERDWESVSTASREQ